MASHIPHSGLNRRTLLRVTATGAGASVLTSGLFTAALARPVLAAPVANVVFNTELTYSSVSIQEDIAIVRQLLTPFEDTHHGIRVTVTLDPSFAITNYDGLVTNAVAGTLADVFHTWQPPSPALEGGILLNLMPFASADNLDFGMFSSQQLDLLRTSSGLWGLPMYLGTMAVFVNLSLLDEAGLQHPQPNWTYSDWASLAKAVTKGGGAKSKSETYGIEGWGLPTSSWQYEAFGGAIQSPRDPLRAALDLPGSIAAVNWYLDLSESNAAQVGGIPFTSGDIFTGRAAMSLFPEWLLEFWLPILHGAGYRWQVYPLPANPGIAPKTYATADYYGASASTKHPQAAWELVKYLGTNASFSLGIMKTRMLAPALKALWPQFVSVVNSVAPFTKNVDIAAFGALALTNQAVPDPVWPYSPSQAGTIQQTYLNDIAAHKMDTTAALHQATAQINALEATGAEVQDKITQEEDAQQSALAKVPVGLHSLYPAPAKTGVGVPPTPANTYVVPGPHGSYTLLGDGSDVYTASNNCIFACAAMDASEGEWICRLTLLTNLTCPHLSQWTKVGIMAAGDLSDDPPFCSPHVTGANQIEWQYRAVPGLTPAGASGLLPKGVKTLTAPNTKPAANYILKPVWLKLSRRGDAWTPWASLNGSQWTQLDPPSTVRMAGAWVGIFACSHNGSFSDKGYVRASFDHLNFHPSRFVQIGKTGTPPAAGPVPRDWATMKPAGL